METRIVLALSMRTAALFLQMKLSRCCSITSSRTADGRAVLHAALRRRISSMRSRANTTCRCWLLLSDSNTLRNCSLSRRSSWAAKKAPGLSVQGHLPEKDGILTCVLVAEMVATRKESLKAQLDQLYRTYGFRASGRRSYKSTDSLSKRVHELVAHPPKTFSGKQVVEVDTSDGLKMILEDGSWTLCRVSGTEQLIRVYAESDNADTLARLMKSSEGLLHQ